VSTRAHTVPRFYLRGFVAPESEKHRDPFVWLGSLSTGTIERRSPKNISISRGFYDGIGGFADDSKSIEAHLSQIESEAAFAIRKYCSTPSDGGANPEPAIWRFLSWQAARTPGWFRSLQEWANQAPVDEPAPIVEPPPEGIERIKDRPRTHWVEDPESGQRYETRSLDELCAYQRRGWKWILDVADRLEALHTQAWYFQVRHFPRLQWTRLDCPQGEYFVTSDRALAWLVDGLADAPPAALRHQTATVVASLTRNTALIGRNQALPLRVSPRDVNRLIAFAASDWIVGPTRSVVEEAIKDRDEVEAPTASHDNMTTPN
jgi:hypothetical protein